MWAQRRCAQRAQLVTDSRRGQEKRGRRRSDAIPPNQLSWENVGKTQQTMTTCGNMCALKTNVTKWAFADPL